VTDNNWHSLLTVQYGPYLNKPTDYRLVDVTDIRFSICKSNNNDLPCVYVLHRKGAGRKKLMNRDPECTALSSITGGDDVLGAWQETTTSEPSRVKSSLA